MALVVEDGSGLSTSESYVSVDAFKAYHKLRGNEVTLGGSEIEQKLRLATEYIDLRWGDAAQGCAIAEDQALVYPTDYWITDPVSLPQALERATFEYAFYAIDNDLFLDNSGAGGPGIKRILEKVGPIEEETEYTGGGLQSVGRKYPVVSKADGLMKQISNSIQGGVYR